MAGPARPAIFYEASYLCPEKDRAHARALRFYGEGGILSSGASPTDVSAWLKVNGFSAQTISGLQWFNGMCLLSSTRYDLECRLGAAEGVRVDALLQGIECALAAEDRDDTVRPPVPPWHDQEEDDGWQTFSSPSQIMDDRRPLSLSLDLLGDREGSSSDMDDLSVGASSSSDDDLRFTQPLLTGGVEAVREGRGDDDADDDDDDASPPETYLPHKRRLDHQSSSTLLNARVGGSWMLAEDTALGVSTQGVQGVSCTATPGPSVPSAKYARQPSVGRPSIPRLIAKQCSKFVVQDHTRYPPTPACDTLAMLAPASGRVCAFLPFKARNDTEISLAVYDVLLVEYARADGWRFCRHTSPPFREGWCPGQFIVPIVRKYYTCDYEVLPATRKRLGEQISGKYRYRAVAQFLLAEPGPFGSYVQVKHKSIKRGDEVSVTRILCPREFRLSFAFDPTVEIGPKLQIKECVGMYVCAGKSLNTTRLIKLNRLMFDVSEDGNHIHIRAVFDPDIDRKLLRRPSRPGETVAITVVADIVVAPLRFPLRVMRCLRVKVYEKNAPHSFPEHLFMHHMASVYQGLSSQTPQVGTTYFDLFIEKWPFMDSFWPDTLHASTL